MMSEMLLLQWNDFQENLKTSLVSLKGDEDFSNVTLACEDGRKFETHKVILATSSPFFHNLLRTNKHKHPLIYMRGMKSEDLCAIIDFLYCGEANVFQENLDSFLAIAEELQLKGLMRQRNDKENFHDYGAMSQESKIKVPVNDRLPKNDIVCTEQKYIGVENGFVSKVAIPEHASADLQKIDSQVKSLMENSEKFIQQGKERKRVKICKVYGKEGPPTAIRDHIEAHHLDGVNLPCNDCMRTYRSRMSLRTHKCNIVFSK